MRTLSKSIHISVSCNITVYKRGHCKGTYGTCGPQSRARCAASGPWLTNGVEECVVLLAKGKKKKKPQKKSLSLLGEVPPRLRVTHGAPGCVLISLLQTLPPL